MVEVAASAQPSAVQLGRASMPPADSTEGCAAHSPISTARKKECGDGSTSLIYVHSSRQGKERAPSPPRVVRFLGASHKRCMGAKGALTEHPPGAGAPTGHPPGGYSESLVVHFFLKDTKWVLGPLLVHVVGSRKFCLQVKWKGLVAKQRAGPLFKQTDGVQQG